MSNLGNIAIRLVLILGAAGIAEISKTIGTRHLTTAAGCLAGGQPDGQRGNRRDPRGHGQDLAGPGRISLAARDHAHRRPCWLISLAARLALDTIIDHASRIAALGTSSILLYLAVTLGVQREIVRRRTAPLAPTEGHHPGWTPPSRSVTDDGLNQMACPQ